MDIKKYFIIYLISTISFISCKKNEGENNCLSFVNAPTAMVEGPTEALVNQEISLRVSFGIINGCGSFNNFKEVSQSNNSEIVVVAKYQGCVCTQVASTEIANYKFVKSTAGTYQLRFLQANNTSLLHTIVVR